MPKRQEFLLNQDMCQVQMQNNSEKNINGIVLFAKSTGQTSFSSLFTIKRALGTKKVGHTGTLDSFAQGLLVVCTGALTRLVSHITAFDKTYQAVIRFGKETDTLEPSGKIVKETELPTIKQVFDAVENFKGKLNQIPPAFSAIHVDGKRLSDIARSGKSVEIPSRQIEVFSSEILELMDENDFIFNIDNSSLQKIDLEKKVKFARINFHVSKGTYIRSLARDIGNFCNSSGYLVGLLRTKVGNFKLEDSVGFEFLPEFTIKSVLENLSALENSENSEDENSPKNFKRIDKEIEDELQNQVNNKLCTMTENLALECGFSVAILKDRFTKDFLNGKKLYKNMFEKLSFENNQSEVAVFAQNPENSQKVFLGVISQNLRYSYVVHNVF